jgi:hypothetical protein
VIDRGLLLTIAVMAVAVPVLARLAPPRTMDRGELLDAALPSVFAGLAAGRLTTLALDDPAALSRLRDILLIRGGMEFWPGVAAGLVLITIAARRSAVALDVRLADLAPFAMWEYALYEALCLVRDGCFGPRAAIGIRPGGRGSPQLPIGVLLAVAVAAAAVVVRRVANRQPRRAVVGALGTVALVRAVASFWLPRIGSALTRQHVESIAVVAIAIAAGTAMLVRRHAPVGGRR